MRRRETINEAFSRFESELRPMRWLAVDEALERAGLEPLSATERDEIDLAAAMGLAPYSHETVQP